MQSTVTSTLTVTLLCLLIWVQGPLKIGNKSIIDIEFKLMLFDDNGIDILKCHRAKIFQPVTVGNGTRVAGSTGKHSTTSL